MGIWLKVYHMGGISGQVYVNQFCSFCSVPTSEPDPFVLIKVFLVLTC
jgi:hypothetical protein